MKGIYSISIFFVLVVFSSCIKKSGKNNYYNTNDYVIKDSLFNKKNVLIQVNYVNKYDSTMKLVKVYNHGIIEGMGFFHNTEKDGPFTIYYPDETKVMAKGCYRNNSLDGELIIYYENGSINKLMYYKNGKKIGSWKTFDSTGHVIDSTVHQ